MPRQRRYNLLGVPQHIVQRGNNRQATFFSEEDYRFYLECLKAAAERHQCDVHAYVLMTNHVHLLVTPHVGQGIAKLMQSLGRRYVQYVNHSYQRTGTLWEGRYKASLVDGERYLLGCYRYCELNPVRAGMVQHPGEYRWSSFRWHAYGEVDDIVTDHELYDRLGVDDEQRQQSYRALFAHHVESGLLKEIRCSLEQCRVLGNEKFRAEIEQALALKARPGRRGRPMKTRV